MIFTLKFSDNTPFHGHSFNHDWEKVPNKPILSLDFVFNQSHIQLKGYKEYHHLYMRNWQTKGNTHISALFLMGRKENSTDIIIYDFINRQGFKVITQIGKEYPVEKYDKKGNFIMWSFDKRIITGWKKGILNQPHCAINKFK